MSKDLLAENFKKVCVNISSNDDFKNQFGFWANDRFLFLADKMCEISLLFDEKEIFIKLVLDNFDAQTDKLKLRFTILKKVISCLSCSTFSFKLLDEIDRLIENSNESATEITENYLKCLILCSKISDSLSKVFFEKAIKSVSEIDVEGFAQIKCIYELSKIGIENSNEKLAYDYARFIEYCNVKLGRYDKKHFPYSEGLVGIANLHQPSVFSILCRWYHRNVIKSGEPLVTILQKSVEGGYIDHIVAASLLTIKTNYNWRHLEAFYRMLVKKFDDAGDPEVKSKFVASEFRVLRLEGDKHYAKILYDEIKSGKFVDKNIILEVKHYNDFLHSLEVQKIQNNVDYFQNKKYQHNVDLKNFDKTSSKAIEREIDVIMTNNESFNNKWVIENFLENVIMACDVSKYVPFLESLVEVSNELLEFHSFENILKKALSDWSFYHEVKKWKDEKFEYILSSKLQHFGYGETLHAFSINDFAAIFSIDKVKLAEIVKRTLPNKLDVLTDESIYNSFELIRDNLTPSQNEELLVWILDRWSLGIFSDIGDGVWDHSLCTEDNSSSNVADLIRFHLGHPVKKIRWRAIHALRRMVDFGNVDVLSALLERQNRSDCRPFQDSNYIYYWMSAKLYLWIAIDRISKENPKKLILFKDIFYQELLSDELPHVLIIQYIQNSCLALLEYDNSIYTEDEINAIRGMNISKFEVSKQKRGSKDKRRNSSESAHEWRYRFNGLDTLPYWFERVGRLFGLSEYDVADVADKIITKNWGYVGNPNVDDYIKNQLYNNDWFLTRNDKGSNPQVEAMSIYWEYHAMYGAADSLLKDHPLVISEYWDDEDEWNYWLKSQGNAFENFWLSDLRDPVPLEMQYWKEFDSKLDESWRDHIDENSFDHGVGIFNDSDFIAVHGGITKHFQSCKESISICSNIVSSENSEALLRALHTTKNSYDYYFPLEKKNPESEDDDHFINDGIFKLEGWLGEIGTEYEGLDSQDELFSHTEKGSIIFGKVVKDKFDITYDNLYKKAFHENSLISVFENWNDLSDDSGNGRKYSSAIETSGSQLKVSKRFLLEFLKKENKDLILRCIIERQLEERYYMEVDEDNRNQVKLYLIKSDGKVKTFRGVDHKIG